MNDTLSRLPLYIPQYPVRSLRERELASRLRRRAVEILSEHAEHGRMDLTIAGHKFWLINRVRPSFEIRD